MAAPRHATALGAAIDAFLARADLAASSRRSYAQTLNRLAAELGPGLELSVLEVDQLGAAVERAWGGCAPATWNRHVATTRSFVAFCRRRGWLATSLEVASSGGASPRIARARSRTPRSIGCGAAQT